MTKRKKAKSAPANSTRGDQLPGTPGETSTARASAPAQSVETPATQTTLALTADCLIAGASALKESLAGLLDEPQPITLDITALQRIDTAGLQVLTAFVRERATHGRPVEWRGTAPALTSAAQLLGLTSLLGLPA
jgi:ABC-type transporter Mla MlaB component